MTISQPEPFNQSDHMLDARGWLCPEPVIAANQWLQKAADGDMLHIMLTDPHGPLDFEVFCLRTGHRLLACEQHSGAQPLQWDLLIECKSG